MKHYLFFLLLIVSACQEEKNDQSSESIQTSSTSKQIDQPNFQTILDSAQLEGSILLYDANKSTFYSNNFEWAKAGRLPASTFKIPNSIIGLETGVVESDSTIFKWDGTEQRLDAWEQDLTFRQALRFSCVPCYQKVARGIGVDRMRDYLQKMEYGNMVVDSNSIDLFWLQGDSKISPFEQIDFLRRLYYSELPIAERTEQTIKSMLVLEETDRYRLSGKTGWAIRNGHNNGWFVGYVETDDNQYFIATNVSPQQAFDMSLFAKIRTEITEKALQDMGIL